MKRFFSILILISLIINSLSSVLAFSNSNADVTVNGNKVSFAREIKKENGEYIFPFKELMAKFGFFIGYDEAEKAYVGNVNNVEAIVPLKGDKACYDLVWIELDNPIVNIQDDVLVELRFIDMLYGIDYTQSENGIDFKVKVEKDNADEAENEEFDIDEYLSTLTPKSVNISSESLFEAKISDPELIAMKEVEVSDAPGFTKAVELENLTEPRLYYDTQITMPIETSVSAGDVLVLTFWARKIKCVDESGFAKFNSCYEVLDATWSKFHTVTEDKLTEEWTRYRYAFVSKFSLNGDGAQLGFRIGFRYQTLQFGNVSVVNYGKKADISLIAPDKVLQTTYYGREEGALWREEALRRIEKYRKNDIKIKVTDEEGNPISDARVYANMTRSEFLWGNAANQQVGFEAARNSLFYQNIQATKFNSFTNETGMKSANFQMDNCVNGVNFARDNNHYFRAHAIFWDRQDSWPAELSDNPTEEEIIEACAKFVSKLAYFFKDSITEVDVLNEPINNDVARMKYGTKFLAEIFKITHELMPDAKLFVNETGITGDDPNMISVEKIKSIVESIIADGGPVEGIGIQNHAAGFVYPQKFYNALDYISENLKYIAITEYDYLSNLSDKSDALKIEADYLKDSIILAYSHPKMTSFTMWGFTDHNHWRANAPLYDKTYNPKPALKYWDEYVWGEWFTKEAAVTDNNGEAVIRGHRGDYEIIVDAYGKKSATTLVLTKDGKNSVTAVVKDNSIDLSSSQKIVPNTTPNTVLNDALFKEAESEKLYLKLYENKLATIQKNTGEDVSFLINQSNSSYCAVDKHSFVLLNLENEMSSGYIKIKSNEEETSLILVEAKQNDGEWKKIYAGEIKDSQDSIYFECDNTTQIKVSGLINTPAMLKHINVSQKEDFKQ